MPGMNGPSERRSAGSLHDDGCCRRRRLQRGGWLRRDDGLEVLTAALRAALAVGLLPRGGSLRELLLVVADVGERQLFP